MVKRLDDTKKRSIAQQYFRSLSLEGWEETNGPVLRGGQATVLIVKNEAGVKGAFRFLNHPFQKEIDRFFREIQILSSHSHPNILRILDYSKNKATPWYIGELGAPFEDFWDKRRMQLTDDPEELVREATDVLRQLSQGLIELHGAKVVHRDIKPANIVLKTASHGRPQPILIDFGLAYVDSETRLSDPDEAVGNLRFSPDVAMYHMSEVPPWLDVHNLGQLFMWMIRKTPDKNWSRALAPRWIEYDSRISADTLLSVRALTASCAEEGVGPRDASELVRLIDRLLPQTLMSHRSKIDVAGIEEGKRRGLAYSWLAKAEDSRIIEASFPMVVRTYIDLRKELELLFSSFKTEVGITVDKIIDSPIGQFVPQLLTANETTIRIELVHWAVGDGARKACNLKINLQGILPSRLPEFFGMEVPPSDFFPFFFHIIFERPEAQTRGEFPHRAKVLSMRRDAEFVLSNNLPIIPPSNLHPPDRQEAISISGLAEIVKNWISDPIIWEVMHKFQSRS